MTRSSIIVVGSGFAGFWAAVAAKRVGGSALDVMVVSPSPVLQLRPRLYEAAPETLGVDIAPLLGRVGVRHVKGEVAAIDSNKRIARLADGSEPSYASIVIATGSRMRRPPIAGANLAYSIDTQPEAILFDRRLQQLAATDAPPTIVVVGAGFTGIELALELRDRLLVHGSPHAETARLILVDRAEAVGSELGQGPRSAIEQALSATGVQVVLGATLTALSDRRVSLADGTGFDADAVVLTTGMVAAAQPDGITGARDSLGRLRVDANLGVEAGVFATGDAAAASTGDAEDHLTLQSCQHALQLGRFAGENAAREALGMPLLTYAQPRYVTCLDLGRAGAVFTEGWSREMRMTGEEAKALKRRINTVVIYPPHDASADALFALSNTDPARQQLQG